MTVKELIEKLQALNRPDADVCYIYDGPDTYEYVDIKTVEPNITGVVVLE